MKTAENVMNNAKNPNLTDEGMTENIAQTMKYANNKGFRVSKVYSDIASGLAYDRGQFLEMLNDVIAHKRKERLSYKEAYGCCGANPIF